VTALSGNRQCYARGSYGSHTTSQYLSLFFWCSSLLADWTGFPVAVHIFSVLCSVFWGCPFLDFVVRGSQAQIVASFFKLILDFDGILVDLTQGRDVQKLHFSLDVSMHIVAILEHQKSLKIFDTQLGAQGMEDICELGHYLVSFMSQCDPFCVQVVINFDRVVLCLSRIP
jgi:hypothetical protein